MTESFKISPATEVIFDTASYSGVIHIEKLNGMGICSKINLTFSEANELREFLNSRSFIIKNLISRRIN